MINNKNKIFSSSKKKTKTIIIPKKFVTTVFDRKHTRLVNGLKGLESEDTEDGFDEVSTLKRL